MSRYGSKATPPSRWRPAAWLLLLPAVLLLLLIMPPDREVEVKDGSPGRESRHSRLRGDGLPPRAPNPWFHVERAFPQGKIPREEWQRAQFEARLLREQTGSRSAEWEQRGPTNIGGRVTDLAVHPSDASIVYAAAAEGGVLKSTDSGASWTPLFDDQPSLSVGAIAIAPSDPNVVYVGTGEVNPGGGSVAYGGTGVYRSTDAGATWSAVGLENSGSIGRIVVDPTDPDRLFVAAMGPLWETSAERGVYRSTDGGASWEHALFVAGDTGCVDLIVRPDNPNVILAAMWQRLRQPEYYSYGGTSCAVYRSTDGGDTWSLLGGGLPSPSSQGGRIGLSLCAAQPDVMCAIYADKTGYFDGLYRSTNGGDGWTRTSDGSLDNAFASYGWWFGNVRVHPTNPNTIFVLGFTFYRSTNGGGSYSSADGIMHVDHHALGFGPGASPVIYEGNDGGLYRSANGGTSWSKLYDLPISQIYRVALDANNPNALYGGLQDNGTCRTTSGAQDDWGEVYGGDGFQALVHPNNSSRIWALYQYGGLSYSSNGGGGWSSATSGLSGRNNWNSPHVQDPTNADTRYFGTDRVHRNSGNTGWTAISGDLTGGSHQGNGGQVNGTLTTIRVSPLDGDVIWCGSDDGYVHVTENGGGSWFDVSAGLPERWITSVRCDPFDREAAYVTVSGFRWAEPLPHVYKTTDLGASWTPIAGNLPEAPANDLIPDPDTAGRYYVATDVGMFFTNDGGASWSALGSGLPNVVVNHLALAPASKTLYAATFGRSFWALDVDNLTALPADSPFAWGRTRSPYPNPGGDHSFIAWELARGSSVSVEIYTVSGRRVWGKALPEQSPGAGSLRWDGVDARGNAMPSGVYFARVRAAGRTLGNETVVLRR